MKRDTILSGIVAVAFHVLILSGPLPTGGVPHGDIYKPVSLSIIRPKPLVSESSPEKAVPAPSSKPPLATQPKVVPQQPHVPKKKEAHKKPVPIKPPVKEREVRVQSIEDVTKATAVPPKAETPLAGNKVESPGTDTVDERTGTSHGEFGADASVETASIDKVDSHDALQKQGMAPGKGAAESIITYAISKENPDPIYPRVARRRGYEGKVVLDVEVLVNGKVGRIKIAKSSGYEVLDRAAVKSVKTWTFTPGTKNGERIPQLVTVPIIFDLKDS